MFLFGNHIATEPLIFPSINISKIAEMRRFRFRSRIPSGKIPAFPGIDFPTSLTHLAVHYLFSLGAVAWGIFATAKRIFHTPRLIAFPPFIFLARTRLSSRCTDHFLYLSPDIARISFDVISCGEITMQFTRAGYMYLCAGKEPNFGYALFY
jgi:hypothetical protein